MVRASCAYSSAWPRRLGNGTEAASPCFTASGALRLEYYDPVSGRLLAIDAQGNGKFNDAGDVLVEDLDANGAIDLSFAAGERLREIEVFVFPPGNGASAGICAILICAKKNTYIPSGAVGKAVPLGN